MPPQLDSSVRAKVDPQELTADEEEVYGLLSAVNGSMAADQIMAMTQAKDINRLMASLNGLLVKGRIDASATQPPSFRARSMEEVIKYANMDSNEKIIYGHIKNVGNKGIWVKDLKQKSNIHTKNVQDAVKSLEKKQFIKSVKSVKNPIKKVYMLFELEPSEEVSGGTWYTDNEFDQEFITTVSDSVERFIIKKSYPGGSSQAIYPPSYTGYPTLTNIVRVLENSKLVNVELKEADVQVIIDRLVFDGKIERKARVAAAMDEDDEDDVVYKAVRDRFGKKTAWTEVPCGTCPVYERCDDEGPITPLKCEYLKKWLAF